MISIHKNPCLTGVCGGSGPSAVVMQVSLAIQVLFVGVRSLDVVRSVGGLAQSFPFGVPMVSQTETGVWLWLVVVVPLVSLKSRND